MLKGLKYKYILCELQFYKDLGNVFWKCYVYRIFKPLYFNWNISPLHHVVIYSSLHIRRRPGIHLPAWPPGVPLTSPGAVFSFL